MSREKAFETELALNCLHLNWTYIKIPDAAMITKLNRHINKEQKRPFDAIISTPKGIIAIECKYQYNQLEPHQKAIGEKIEDQNGMFVVLRKVDRTRGIAYYVAENTSREPLTPRLDSPLQLLYKIKEKFML